MARVFTVIAIPAPVEDVFEFVTTPATWPRWHPSSRAVSGATDHSLAVGEEVTEEFLVAGRRGQARWTVEAREAPYLWSARGEVPGGGRGELTYICAPGLGGTVFGREFVYSFASWRLALLDRLVFGRRIRAESVEALRRLRAALEARGALLPIEGGGGGGDR